MSEELFDVADYCRFKKAEFKLPFELSGDKTSCLLLCETCSISLTRYSVSDSVFLTTILAMLSLCLLLTESLFDFPLLSLGESTGEKIYSLICRCSTYDDDFFFLVLITLKVLFGGS